MERLDKLMTLEAMLSEYRDQLLFVDVLNGTPDNFTEGIVRFVTNNDDDARIEECLEYCDEMDWGLVSIGVPKCLYENKIEVGCTTFAIVKKCWSNVRCIQVGSQEYNDFLEALNDLDDCTDDVMLTPNRLMSWEEMKREYPRRWVFVKVVEGNHTNFTKGIVLAVVSDDRLADGMEFCKSKGWNYTYARTTICPFLNSIC